jgi:hypothetical protein
MSPRGPTWAERGGGLCGGRIVALHQGLLYFLEANLQTHRKLQSRATPTPKGMGLEARILR